MEGLFATFGTMLACSVLFLWARAAYIVARRGDKFSWKVFFRENVNRMLIQFSGCFFFAVAWEMDPAGVTGFLTQFGLVAYLGSVGAIGAGIGFFSQWFWAKAE